MPSLSGHEDDVRSMERHARSIDNYAADVEAAAQRLWPLIRHHMGRDGVAWEQVDAPTALAVRKYARAAIDL